MWTEAPASAKLIAIALPMPLAPPVMTAFLPSSRNTAELLPFAFRVKRLVSGEFVW
jgi:hypothetical protein